MLKLVVDNRYSSLRVVVLIFIIKQTTLADSMMLLIDESLSTHILKLIFKYKTLLQVTKRKPVNAHIIKIKKVFVVF